MAIKLLIGTEDVPQLKNQIDDDNGSWWGGVHLAGSRLAFAGTLAAAALTTGLAQQVATQQQDDPAGKLYRPIDEDYWQQPVPSTPLLARQAFIDEDHTTQLTFSPEEDSWTVTIPPQPATVYQQPWFHQDEVFPATSFGPEEDYWPRSSQVGNSYLARIFQDEGDLIGTPIVVATSTATDPEIHLFKLNYTNKMHKL